MKGSRLRNRDRYLEEAMLFRDTDLIKVITGVRRCGKSSLLDLIRMAIESEGASTWKARVRASRRRTSFMITFAGACRTRVAPTFS